MTGTSDLAKVDTVADVTLIADPRQQRESDSSAFSLIDKRDIGANRIILTRKIISDLCSNHVWAVEIEVTFDPARGNRFESADLKLVLKEPEGARFLNIEPSEVIDENTISMTHIEEDSFAVLWAVLRGSGTSRTEVKYEFRHVILRGSGAGTNCARWVFSENPHCPLGIPPRSRFTVLLTKVPSLKAEFMVDVSLVRPGLGQAMEAVRRMIAPRRTISVDLGLG